ncbi:MAG: helix-turn-helix domain-containing protein [Alphaproteobacteria bacterium]|nr:helix-turn-helix domain-containing protein [Alphaproteobacteria bacterium]
MYINAQSYGELGAILRQAREKRRYALTQVADYVHIRQRYLQALEEGALDQLPGSAYVKGYLQQYARFLGLPENEVLAAYERIGAVPQRRFFHLPDTLRREENPGRPLMWVALALAVGLAVWTSRTALRPTPALPLLPKVAEKTAKPHQTACSGAALSAWPPCYSSEIHVSSPFMIGTPRNKSYGDQP